MVAKKPQGLSTLYTFLVVVLPIVGIYAIPGLNLPISLGELFVIFLLPLLLVDMLLTGKTVAITNPFYLYIAYAGISTLAVSCAFLLLYDGFSVSSVLVRVIRDIFYLLLIIFFGKDFFDFKKAKKIIKVICCLLSAFIFVQFFAYQLFGIYVSGFIPGIRTTLSGGVVSNQLSEHFLKSAMIDGYVRPHGFMAEPAAAAHFLSVGLILSLFSTDEKKSDIRSALVLSLAMIFTTSINAFAALVFCWFLWIMYRGRRGMWIVYILIFVLVAVAFGIPIILMSDFAQDIVGRIIALFDGSGTQNSAAIRILRGPFFYFEMPFIFKIFGSGFGNFDAFKNAFQINTVYEQADEYFNTNSYVAISSGVIGLFLYIWSIWKNTAGRYWVSKAMALLLFLYGFSSSIYSTGIFAIMLLLTFNAPKEKKAYDKYYNFA